MSTNPKFSSRDRASFARESARMFRDLEMKLKEKKEKDDRRETMSSSSGSRAGQDLDEWIIFTSCWQ